MHGNRCDKSKPGAGMKPRAGPAFISLDAADGFCLPRAGSRCFRRLLRVYGRDESAPKKRQSGLPPDLAPQQGDGSLDGQIDQQNGQRHNGGVFKLHLCLKLVDHQGDRLGGRARQKGDG